MITDPPPTGSTIVPHRGRNLILNSMKRKTNLRWLILKLKFWDNVELLMQGS
ncbi:hypothetical protein Tco_0392286, partial [Tanacetum coccineum]